FYTSTPRVIRRPSPGRAMHRRLSFRALFRDGQARTARRVQSSPGSRTDVLISGATAPVNDLRLR
ncbi:MAG TPA: hypothetical protein VHC49_08260, partial [Mycobacteriales bacterium]|nr:hypothetical protein [Mycobacteriales bacterium]